MINAGATRIGTSSGPLIIQELSAPVCRQAGWLNAECRMQIEKCKIAFCQIGMLARLHVRIGN